MLNGVGFIAFLELFVSFAFFHQFFVVESNVNILVMAPKRCKGLRTLSITSVPCRVKIFLWSSAGRIDLQGVSLQFILCLLYDSREDISVSNWKVLNAKEKGEYVCWEGMAKNKGVCIIWMGYPIKLPWWSIITFTQLCYFFYSVLEREEAALYRRYL